MPERQQSDPLVTRIGQRLHELRQESGYSLLKLIGAAARPGSRGGKGFLSQVENGKALPTAVMLERLAGVLGIDLVDMVNFPERGLRNQLLERTRGMKDRRLKQLLMLADCDPRTLMRAVSMVAESVRSESTRRRFRTRSKPGKKRRTTEHSTALNEEG